MTEVRAGVYVMFDLVMHNIGVCDLSDIALSVLTTVIGHQEEKGWAIVDAGWMAMSRDRGTQRQAHDFGYGQVCTEQGDVLGDYVMSAANQEHGIVSRAGTPDAGIAQRFPIGTRLRILPNHACATGAQHPEYQAIGEDGGAQTCRASTGGEQNRAPASPRRFIDYLSKSGQNLNNPDLPGAESACPNMPTDDRLLLLDRDTVAPALQPRK